ncbi:carbohydrate porin [Microcoleus sp. FACHB-68]|nr:iron uptake porin [Microcoleus sp. FACHB-68]MBD1938427.1 carbohydrate porin [Microcoleus sp. FACHB-68]
MDQVTSVSQLTDVQPTDWAFQALQNLVERYGCIAGYPDGTFRGNRALTRYEFAAGLNACLEVIVGLIGQDGDFATKEDLALLQRLQEEFQVELATLRGRVDALEARTIELESNQFSTITKLSGLAFFNVTKAGFGDTLKVETTDLGSPLEIRPAGRNSVTNRPIIQTTDDEPATTFSNLVWLTLQTSFTGEDSLVTQLAVGNGNSPANALASAGLYNTFGAPYTDQTAGPNISSGEVVLRELFYEFPVVDKIRLVVGPRINWYRYFDNNAFTFFLTGAGSFNSISSTLSNTLDRGAGAVVLLDFSKQFKFRFGYLAESNEYLPTAFFDTASDPNEGFFNATNTLTAEVIFSPSDRANIRLNYTRSKIDANVPIFDENGNLTGFGVGGATGEPIYGVADDGFGGSIENASADTFGLNFDWLVTRGFGLFGRYSYGSTNIEPTTSGRPSGEVNAQAFQFGLAFPNLGRQGSLATLSFLVPFDVLDGRGFLAAGGGNGGTQYEIEASYFLPVTDNIAVVPAFYVIGNPNNFDDNPTIFIGNLRSQFSF